MRLFLYVGACVFACGPVRVSVHFSDTYKDTKMKESLIES